MNKDNLIILGAVASIIALILYFMSQKDSGSPSVNMVYEVTGISPEVAAIRSQERMNADNNRTSLATAIWGYFAGVKNADTSKEIASINANAGVEVAKNAGAVSQILGLAETDRLKNLDNLNAQNKNYQNELQSGTTKYVANKQASVAKTQAWTGLFGGITDFFGSIF